MAAKVLENGRRLDDDTPSSGFFRTFSGAVRRRQRRGRWMIGGWRHLIDGLSQAQPKLRFRRGSAGDARSDDLRRRLGNSPACGGLRSAQADGARSRAARSSRSCWTISCGADSTRRPVPRTPRANTSPPCSATNMARWISSIPYEQTALGTGGALRNAAGLVRENDVLAMNGDSFCDVDLRALDRIHRSLAARPHSPSSGKAIAIGPARSGSMTAAVSSASRADRRCRPRG